MNPFIANTDRTWFNFLSSRSTNGLVDEVNFWQPTSTRPMKRMEPGEPVFFRLKSPINSIAGYGFLALFQAVTLEQAWDLFGWRNGEDTRIHFLRLIGGYRNEDLSIEANRRREIGCTILRDARFWPEPRWIPWGAEQGWQSNIVQGKTEKDPLRAAQLLELIGLDHAAKPAELGELFTPLTVDMREVELRRMARRDGQGTFRLRLLDAYGRCAITGEKTHPVLDAAHIQPYMGPASNHLANGLLLTKEFHTLFDKGYVTVTPDYLVRVSGALREEWQNGVRYYAYDQQPLRRLPDRDTFKPSRDALAWHNQAVFRG